MVDLLRWISAQGLTWFFVAFFALLFAANELGYRTGLAVFHRRTAEATARAGLGFIVGGMIALLAFLMGTALSIAETRFDARRTIVLDEANAIGTSWLRAGQIGGEDGAAIQRLLADYTRLRIAAIQGEIGTPRVVDGTRETQRRMWEHATRIARAEPTPPSALLAASLNETFAAATTARRAFTATVPLPLLRVLLWTTLIAVGAMGYHFGAHDSRQPLMSALLLVLWALTTTLIVDMSRPWLGTIVITPAPLEWTLAGFGPQE